MAMKFTIFVLGLFLFISPIMAQESDAVYLKDGSIIKGEIVETTYTTDLRIETIKVKIAGGSILAFTGDQIQKIQTGQKESPAQKSTSLKPQPRKQKKITGYKSPSTACILSIILFPGIGQFYNEQPGKGAVFFVAGLVGAVMLFDGSKEITTIHENYYFNNRITTRPNNEGEAKIGALLYLGTWIFSAVDAYGSAKKINESLALSLTPNRVSLCYRF